MTEQFEQAKREFAQKWCIKVIECMKGDDYIMHAPDEMLPDLTALLEQHKEVIKEDLRQKLLSMRATKEEMDKLDKEDRLMQYGYHHCINEMLIWTKSLKP